MANKTFKHSDHASHLADPGQLTWMRNTTTTNFTVTDEGHVLPGKTCAGMSSLDETTRKLVDSGTLILCSTPATDRGKPREKEVKRPDAKSSGVNTQEEKPD
mgnify:CR=1 FL=1|jgi:hypothetical protein|tara:strand:- start:433 stop:738 length:306 start_codon:yes stop_codon:yes gene_type:complete